MSEDDSGKIGPMWPDMIWKGRGAKMGFTISDGLIVLATLLSPLIAVIVTRLMDERRSRRDRQRTVFETLMLTRRASMSQEHVRALNQIELEFASDRDVTAAFRAYFDNLGIDLPSEPAALERATSRRRRLFAELVQIIGERLNFKIDKMDLIEGGYYPRGWQEDEHLARNNGILINEVLRARRPLWITGVPQAGVIAPPIGQRQGAQPSSQSPFPPPPEDL